MQLFLARDFAMMASCMSSPVTCSLRIAWCKSFQVSSTRSWCNPKFIHWSINCTPTGASTPGDLVGEKFNTGRTWFNVSSLNLKSLPSPTVSIIFNNLYIDDYRCTVCFIIFHWCQTPLSSCVHSDIMPKVPARLIVKTVAPLTLPWIFLIEEPSAHAMTVLMYTRRPPKQPSSRVTSLNMLFLGRVQITGSLTSTVNRIRCIWMIGMWCFKRRGYALTCFSCKALLGCYHLRN